MRLKPRIPRPAPKRADKPKAWRSAAHLDFIRGIKLCAATGARGDVDAHHLVNITDDTGRKDLRGGRRRGDDLTIPLKHRIHMAAHASGRPEEYLLKKYGVLCRELAAALMRVSGDHDAGVRVVERHLADARMRMGNSFV